MAVSSLVGFLGFADLGIGNGLMNCISAACGKNDGESLRKYVSTALFLYILIATSILVVFASVYFFVPWARLFNVGSTVAAQESGPTAVVLVALFAVSIPLGVAQRVHIGYQEGFINNIWWIIGNLLGLGGLLGAIRLEAGLPWLVLCVAGGPTAASLLNWITLFGRSRRWLLPCSVSVNLKIGGELGHTGVKFLILQIMAIIGYSSDNLIISNVLGASAVTSFAITQKIASTILIAQYLLDPLWPAYGEAMARGDHEWAHKTLIRSLWFIAVIGLAAFCVLFGFGKPLIEWWVGAEFVPPSSLLAGFSIWVVLMLYISAMSVFLNSSNSLVGKQIGFFSAAAVSSLILKVILTHKWGASGAIWATIIGFGVFYIIPSGHLAFGALRLPCTDQNRVIQAREMSGL